MSEQAAKLRHIAKRLHDYNSYSPTLAGIIKELESLASEPLPVVAQREIFVVKDDGFTYAWIVERGNQRIEYLGGTTTWVSKPEEAQWFCRRRDAVLQALNSGSQDWKITQHAFDLSLPKGEQKKIAEGAIRGFAYDLAMARPTVGPSPSPASAAMIPVAQVEGLLRSFELMANAWKVSAATGDAWNASDSESLRACAVMVDGEIKRGRSLVANAQPAPPALTAEKPVALFTEQEKADLCLLDIALTAFDKEYKNGRTHALIDRLIHGHPAPQPNPPEPKEK